jgi:germination protein M
MLLLISTLSSCNKKRDEFKVAENVIDLYFMSSNDYSYVTEKYELQGFSLTSKIEEVLNQLIKGPKEVGNIALLSREVEITNILIENDIVKIVFASEYANKPQDEFIARTSILSSIGQIESVSNVEFYIDDQPIKDINDKIVGTMHINNYIVSTGNLNEFKRNTNIKLYFANEKGTKLIQQVISADIPFSLPMEYTITELLIKGPISTGQYPTINPDTKINSIRTKNGVCYIDLSKEFLEDTSNISEEVAVYSLVNTLAELSNFNKIRIYIDGKSPEFYHDEVKINVLLERNLDVIEN